MKKPALISAVLLLLFFVGTSAQGNTNFRVQVNVSPSDIKIYSTSTAYRGSLFGGLMRLKYSNQGFNFQYIPNDDYGPFLQSVNGLAGNSSHYWQLLSGKTPLDVGMGCYLPTANEVVTLKYTKT
ncbi:cobalamin binding intrinsic factor-like [Pelmatolapia mariae]|uniref:cobalamin binding intrinsic factor-like n=1 Tax=Pelmatolapia mariae TaxID=158779 RepID=UPI002FE65FC6